MKTAKKSLAVLLVVVMALGLMSFASAATPTFTDAASIKNTEAVLVTSTLGIFQGYEDGSFGGDRTLTRAEAATIVTRLLLGATADALPSAATGFKDVPASHWASKYISYCVAQGIIKGYGNGTFGPSDTLTASQFAIMLLRALGFGKNGEYEGSMWQVNAIVDGMKYGILSGTDDFTANAPRDNVALYAFNALIYSPTASTTDKIWGLTGWDNNKPIYGWIDVPSVAKDSLGWTVFKLDRDVDQTDDLGRLSTHWYYGDNKTPITDVTNDSVSTFTKAFTQDDLYKIVGTNTDISVTWNSAAGQVTSTLTSLKGGTYNADVNPNVTPAGTLWSAGLKLGNGVITQVFKSSSSTYSATVIEPSFDKLNITSFKATSTRGAYNSYSITGKGVAGNIFTSIVNADNDVNTAVLTGDMAKDDWVTYYKGANNAYFSAVTSVSGVLTSVTSANVVTIGGATYSPAKAWGAPAFTVSKDEQSFYVDSNGYLLGVKEAAAGPLALALLVSVDSYSVLDGNKVVTNYTATLVGLDGKVITVPTTKDDFDKANLTSSPTLGNVCQYTYTASTGTYSAFTTTYTGDPAFARISALTKIDSKTTDLSTNSSVGTTFTTYPIQYAGSSTTYVLVNYMTPADGSARVPDGTVTIYTGTNNVPSYTALSKTTAVSAPPSPVNSTYGSAVASIVFIYDDVYAAATSKYVYVVGTWTQTGDGYAVDVITDGGFDTIVAKDTAGLATLTSLSGKLYENVSVGSDGLVTYGDEAKQFSTIVNNSGLLFATSASTPTLAPSYRGTIASDTPVYTIAQNSKPADTTVDEGTAADIMPPYVMPANSYACYNIDTNNAVTAVYIVTP